MLVAQHQGRPTFEVERFARGTRGRLEVAGRFIGLHDPPTDVPVLVLHGHGRTHRLRAVPDSVSGPPQDGRPWSAEFEWSKRPAAFDRAELQLGADITVGLGEPAAESVGAERIRVEAELVAVQQELRDLRMAEQRLRDELARAHEELQTAADRRAADAELFREGLARVRASAEEALALEQSAARDLGAALREARDTIDAKDEALQELRRERDAEKAAHRRSASEAEAAADALRRETARVENARSAADDARAEAEDLLRRLTRVLDALGD